MQKRLQPLNEIDLPIQCKYNVNMDMNTTRKLKYMYKKMFKRITCFDNKKSSFIF